MNRGLGVTIGSILFSGLAVLAGCMTLTGGGSNSLLSDGTVIASNPEEAKIVTSDIANFWYAYDTATPESELTVFREEYLRRGTQGLKEFARLKIGRIDYFVRRIRRHSKYYASIRQSTLSIQTKETEIRSVFRKLKDLYSESVFPPLYFLIGPMNTGGVMTDRGLIIGIELYSKTGSSPLDELTPWEQSVVRPVESVPLVVAHELVHYQQHFKKKPANLLGRSIAEGGADFLSEVITGDTLDKALYRYGKMHEEQLWNEFRAVMQKNDWRNWLYNGGGLTARGALNDRPADLGYFVGYRICKAYYERANDKMKAIKDILEIRDFNEFLSDSGYGSSFAMNN
jgi:hypothetical protein